MSRQLRKTISDTSALMRIRLLAALTRALAIGVAAMITLAADVSAPLKNRWYPDQRDSAGIFADDPSADVHTR
jgi:hypothetical protein